MSYYIQKGGGLFGGIIILIFALAITADIVKKIIKRVREGRNASDKTSMDILGMIYFDLFIILGHIILVTFNFTFSSNETDCKLITKICTALFHGSRSILYLIFVRRLQVIYGNTMFALSKLHTYLLYFIIAIYSIPYIAYFNWNSFDTKYDEQLGCLVEYKPSIYLLIVYILHIVIATYCLYLFVYPLYRLIKAMDDEQDCKLYNVMIKFSILYSSSIYSSWILIIISYLLPFGYNYSMIDNFINGMTLILLHPIHNKLYKSLCCLPHYLCIYVCDAPNEEDTKSNLNRKRSVAVNKPNHDGDPVKSVQDLALNKQQKDVSSEMEQSEDTITAGTTIRAYKDRVNRKSSNCSESPPSPSPPSPPSPSSRPISWQITDRDQSIKSSSMVSLRDTMKDRVQRKLSIDAHHVNIPQLAPVSTGSPPPPSPSHFVPPIERVRTLSVSQYPPHQTSLYAPHQTVSYPVHQTVSCPGHQTVSYAPHQTLSYSPHKTVSYPSPAPLHNDNVVVITLNKQTRQKTDRVRHVTRLKFKPFPSIRSIQSLKGLEFEQTQSNTLEFIKYESNRL